jgi:hypothetical protein
MFWFRILICFVCVHCCASQAGEQRIYLLSKRQMVESNYTLVVFFYDRGIVTMADCEREIQRGVRGQWRYYNHKFQKPSGYSEKIDYYCVQSTARIDPWYDKASYDSIFQIDLRDGNNQIRKMQHYADCLRDLRQHIRDENRFFFCGKVSQAIAFYD